MAYSKKIFLTFDEVFESIKNTNFVDILEYDWYAIYRGGLSMAHMMSILYKHKNFGIIFPKHNRIIHPNKTSDNCLLIEDTLYSGNTYRKCLQIIDKYTSYGVIKLYSLIYDPTWSIKPDTYSIYSIFDNKNVWITPPWEAFDNQIWENEIYE